MADNDPVLIPLRLETICIALMQLGDRVNAALHRQIGDRVRLHEQNSGGAYWAAERQVMEVSIDAMIQALATAAVQSEDLPHGSAVQVTYQEATGHRGRPRIEINYDFLAYGLELRGPTGLALVAEVSSRTICRRALEYGLVEPAAPVYTETIDEATSEVIRMYTSSTTGPVSTIADDALDQLMHLILEIFPTFGRRMIAGNLRRLGHRSPTLTLRLDVSLIAWQVPTLSLIMMDSMVYTDGISSFTPSSMAMIQNGVRGFDERQDADDDDDVEDLDAYGIDWAELHNADIMEHHAEHNSDQDLNPDAIDNPFANEGPHRLSHVEVEEPLCPSGIQDVASLDAHLALNPHSHSHGVMFLATYQSPVLVSPVYQSLPPKTVNRRTQNSMIWTQTLFALAHAVDFELNEMLDVNQLVADLENGQFSSVPVHSQQSAAELQPYESPLWLAPFIQHLLDQQYPPRVRPACMIAQQGITPSVVPTIRTPKEILTRRYSTELSTLSTLHLVGYGVAYLHYTRYRILDRVASDTGLQIDTPSQISSVDGVCIAYQDLFEWAQVNAGSFGNVKRVIVQSEQIREQLSRLPSESLTARQAILLGNLNTLVRDPDPTTMRGAAMGWTLADLRRAIQGLQSRQSQHLETQRPLTGPRPRA
ncbi:hypothetical protein B0H19DRAFT_1276282 [Mycena capillaripes]|nr:hypothetical protein B0H19DRAFT_1276282 [Mycena capillaripes]